MKRLTSTRISFPDLLAFGAAVFAGVAFVTGQSTKNDLNVTRGDVNHIVAQSQIGMLCDKGDHGACRELTDRYRGIERATGRELAITAARTREIARHVVHKDGPRPKIVKRISIPAQQAAATLADLPFTPVYPEPTGKHKPKRVRRGGKHRKVVVKPRDPPQGQVSAPPPTRTLKQPDLSEQLNSGLMKTCRPVKTFVNSLLPKSLPLCPEEGK